MCGVRERGGAGTDAHKTTDCRNVAENICYSSLNLTSHDAETECQGLTLNETDRAVSSVQHESDLLPSLIPIVVRVFVDNK